MSALKEDMHEEDPVLEFAKKATMDGLAVPDVLLYDEPERRDPVSDTPLCEAV